MATLKNQGCTLKKWHLALAELQLWKHIILLQWKPQVEKAQAPRLVKIQREMFGGYRKPLNLQIGSFPFLRLTHLKVKHVGGSMQILTMLLKTFLCCTTFEDRPTADEQALLVVNAIMISFFADEKTVTRRTCLCRHCRLVEHQNLQIWEATPPTKGPYRSAPDTNPIPSLMVTCHKCLATLEYNSKCGRCGVHVVKSATLSAHGQVGLFC